MLKFGVEHDNRNHFLFKENCKQSQLVNRHNMKDQLCKDRYLLSMIRNYISRRHFEYILLYVLLNFMTIPNTVLVFSHFMVSSGTIFTMQRPFFLGDNTRILYSNWTWCEYQCRWKMFCLSPGGVYHDFSQEIDQSISLNCHNQRNTMKYDIFYSWYSVNLTLWTAPGLQQIQ